MRGYRQQYLKQNMEITDDQTKNALGTMKKHVYQEDRALFNHMKVKNPKDLHHTEIQALMKIASSGLDLQLKLEKAIQGMTIEMTERSRLNGKDKQLQIMAGTLMMLKRLRGDFRDA